MAFRSIEHKQYMNNNGKWMVEIWLYEDRQPKQMLESKTFDNPSLATSYIFDSKVNYQHLTYRP